MDFELDIEKYTLEDLLALFHLTVQFDERDLKNARKSVLRLHPDKSHLDPTYFIFYTKAYNMLLGIWKFRQGSSGDKNTAYSLHEQEDQRGRQGFIDKKMKEEEFNSWFNREFEKAKVENPHTDKGYGQWLVADETESPGADIHQVKRNARQLVVAREVSCASSSASFGEMIDGSGEFRSGLFSNKGLVYEDLQVAHTETVVPVTEEDDFHNRQQFGSVDELISYRSQTMCSPLSKEESIRMLDRERNEDNESSSRRHYEIAKQTERAVEKSKTFWSGLQQLRY